jgi:hypothetical protein
MASPSIRIDIAFPDVERLKQEFAKLRPALARKHMGAAITRTLKPALMALRTTTPKGPTGNLKRAIASKVTKYQSGNIVGLVGYRRTGTGKTQSTKGKRKLGNDRAFHQHFVEFGTKRRTTKGAFASSFKTLGPFQIKKSRSAVSIRTAPAYPKAFFKRAPRGQGVDLGSMPIGGTRGQPPVRTAFERALPEMKASMPENMAISLNNALKDIADKFPRKPTETKS